MNKYLRKGLYVGLSALMIASVSAFASASNKVSASGYLTASISRARRSRDYATRSMSLEHLSNSDYFAGIRNTGRARIHRGEKIGVVPFYHMGRDGFIVKIPGKRGIYYAPTNNHNWFGRSYRFPRRRNKAKKSVRRVTRKRRRTVKRAKRMKRVKHYNRKARVNHKRNKKRRRSIAPKAMRSRFKRSNSRRALKRSGYFDARSIGGNFIFDKYAPNDKRAVVPKNFNGTNWYQGKFGQANPTGYYYDSMAHGWIEFK